MEGLFLAFMWAVERVRSPILGSIMAGILITLVIFSGLAIVFVVLKDLLPSIDVMSLFYGAVLLGYPLGVSLGVCYIAQRRRQGGSPRRAVLGAILGLTLAIVLLGYDDLAMRLGFELPE